MVAHSVFSLLGSHIQFIFLDRDGVINERLVGEYVRTISEFKLLPDVNACIALFNTQCKRVCIVTNQQGIGKGLMTEADLHAIHSHWLLDLESEGGHIDKIYFAPHLACEHSPMRKPGIGMLLHAQTDFPEIDFHKSLVIGDSDSDIQMGKQAGTYTISIGRCISEQWKGDWHYDSISDLYRDWQNFNKMTQ